MIFRNSVQFPAVITCVAITALYGFTGTPAAPTDHARHGSGLGAGWIGEAAGFFLDDCAIIRGDWEIHQVDYRPNDNGALDIAVDSLDGTHLAYRDATNGTLRYAFLDESGIERALADGQSSAGWNVALSLDGDGRPHIAHHYPPLNRVRYAVNRNDTWEREETAFGVATAAVDKRCLDIQVAADGYPRLVRTGMGSLAYDTRNGAGWSTMEVDTTGDPGWFPCLMLDFDGTPNIASQRRGSNEVIWSRLTGSTWSNEVVAAGAIGGWVSAAMTPNGDRFLCYQVDNHLACAVHDGAAWSMTTVDSTSGAAWSASLSLRPDLRPAIAYIIDGAGMLRYAVRQGVQWQYEDVWGPSVPLTCALAHDKLGRPRIAFVDHGLVWLAKKVVETTTVMVLLNDTVFSAGDRFVLRLKIETPDTPVVNGDLYLVLEVFGEYFFFPTWSTVVEAVPLSLPGSQALAVNLLDFTWPGGVAPIPSAAFWMVITAPGDVGTMVSNVDMAGFSTL
ncbi:hypothetical protein JW905_00025 [bacterium]|nr:hypothetical protein [candidate division CSSED10-310 bacterium]